MGKKMRFMSGLTIYMKVDQFFEITSERRFRRLAEARGMRETFDNALRHYREIGADKASFRAYKAANRT